MPAVDNASAAATVAGADREDRAMLRSNPSARSVLEHGRGHLHMPVPPPTQGHASAPKRKTCRFWGEPGLSTRDLPSRQQRTFLTYVNILCRGCLRFSLHGGVDTYAGCLGLAPGRSHVSVQRPSEATNMPPRFWGRTTPTETCLTVILRSGKKSFDSETSGNRAQAGNGPVVRKMSDEESKSHNRPPSEYPGCPGVRWRPANGSWTHARQILRRLQTGGIDCPRDTVHPMPQERSMWLSPLLRMTLIAVRGPHGRACSLQT